MAREVETHSPEETEALGQEFGATLRAGDVVLLEGELGSGKTTFVKGLAKACGVKSMVRSPTFALMHRYRGDPDVIHIDLYREESPASLEDLALDEQDDAVIVVEWPKGLTDARFERARRVILEHIDEGTRRIALP